MLWWGTVKPILHLLTEASPDRPDFGTAVPGEYCPGPHSVNARGTLKLAEELPPSHASLASRAQ